MEPENKLEETTHFGYQQVPVSQKEEKVRDVFHSVASRYDLMNDFMSFGIHRWWKAFTLHLIHLRPGQRALDLAGGTGDLALQLAKKVGPTGEVILADINQAMLSQGRTRLENQGILRPLHYVQANAEQLPFPTNYFHCVTIAFGLRNVTHKEKALGEMFRVLKPGGRLFILEFSKPVLPGLSALYDTYSFKVLPWLGEKVVGDRESYQYLAESIRMHPPQEELKTMMEAQGFERCQYHHLTGGIVALHEGVKL